MSALTDTFTSIANAIRAKTGKSGTMTPAQMVTEIAGIPSGGGNIALYEVSKKNSGTYSISFSENAKYIIVPTVTNCDNQQGTNLRGYGTIIFDIENNRHTMVGPGHTSQSPATWASGLSPVSYYMVIVSSVTGTITFSSVTKNSITFTDSAGAPAYRDIVVIY